jgi:transposase
MPTMPTTPNPMESLFTSALGLKPPFTVADVKLDTAARRIDFEIACTGALACPACGRAAQPVHDRLRRSWRHLDFFQFEAWLHCDVPRVACGGCGKTTQTPVPWARPGSGFTAAFEALALALCQQLPVRQAAAMLRCTDKALWRQIAHHVEAARRLQDHAGVQIVGIDETSLHRGQSYVSVMHDLQRRRLLFATPGRDSTVVAAFARDLAEHGGDPAAVRHVCMDMSAAYAKGVRDALPDAQISYDRFHVIAMAHDAMDAVRREELKTDRAAVREALNGRGDAKTLRQLLWGMRRNPSGWTQAQTQAMHWLQHSYLKSARAWRLKMALREVYLRAKVHDDTTTAARELRGWLSWARRCRLEPFKKLAATLGGAAFDAVVRGMTEHRSNAFVEAMNAQMQLAKRAARGYRTAQNFIHVAYLRLAKLTHLPASPYHTAPAGG